MSAQADRQARAMELLQIIGRAKRTAEDVAREFTVEEITEAKVLAFEGGYSIAWFALDALRLAKKGMEGKS